jgi:hypothetical protein
MASADCDNQSTTEKRDTSFVRMAYPIHSMWAPLARKALKFSGNLANDFLMMLSTKTPVFIFSSTAFQGRQKQTFVCPSTGNLFTSVRLEAALVEPV